VTKTRQVLQQLGRFESRNVTHIEVDGSWPIVWASAHGNYVRDAEGRKYLDLTAAFGVAAAGHANQRVVRAGQKQMSTLLHAMGDVHPHAAKAQLARELSAITFERWSRKATHGKVIFSNSGFEAVEAALKTAVLATGRKEVIAFHGAYHGLGYGALNVTHRAHFRSPFRSQLREFGHFVPFPYDDQQVTAVEKKIRQLLKKGKTGAVLVEPIQARGGINIPPTSFLRSLRKLCDQYGALLILDEIYTGFGRTGKWFACEHSGVIPDVICLGKALTGGFPLSACVGRANLMDSAWPASSGEAIHTSTYLGHPVGCAMALAQIQEIRKQSLVDRSRRRGVELLNYLRPLESRKTRVRGLGLMVGVELLDDDGKPDTRRSIAVMKDLLQRGFIILPEGQESHVLGFTPTLTISGRELQSAVSALKKSLLSIL
jgi:4-aminobutyrate aminotransferase-like enzyme